MDTSARFAKDVVRRQYGSVGDAYGKSTGHATGSDLDRMVALAQPASQEILLDSATGGGHVARVFAPHVTAEDREDLARMILSAPGVFDAEIDPDDPENVLRFTDVKTLFLATR